MRFKMVYYINGHKVIINGCKKNNKNVRIVYDCVDTVYIGEHYIKIKDAQGCCMFDKKAYNFHVGNDLNIFHE